MTLLTIVVPSYNSEDYLRRCLDSLVAGDSRVEILVIDDGSCDSTPRIGADYGRRYPGTVRVISQANLGHGGAINTGLRHASGQFLKVVDSDDWLDTSAYGAVLEDLDRLSRRSREVDVVVSNYVYEKVGRRHRQTIRYRSVLPAGSAFGWEDMGRFHQGQYLSMHSLIYRTELLREVGLHLPEHTFYVDNLYAYLPMHKARRFFYSDHDLYRYYIGREDQSVNEAVMIRRIDQQLRVNRLMLTQLARNELRPPQKRDYLTRYLEIVCVISSMMLLRSGTPAHLERKEELWDDVRGVDPDLYRALRRGALGRMVNLPGRLGRELTSLAYLVARRVIGFN